MVLQSDNLHYSNMELVNLYQLHYSTSLVVADLSWAVARKSGLFVIAVVHILFSSPKLKSFDNSRA